MTKDEKLKLLHKLDEKELTKRFLTPLFEAMGFIGVRYTHRKLEFGKDVVYYEDDKYGKRIYTGVLVKKIKITTSNVDVIFRQIHEVFAEPFTNLDDSTKRDFDRLVVLTSNEFTEETEDFLRASLKGSRLDKLITCVDGSALVDLLDKHMPFAFWDEYDYFKKYFSAVKAALEVVQDISAVRRLESAPLEEIYVSLRLVEPEAMRERKIYSEKERRLIKGKIYDIEGAVRDFDRLVIVGAPGSGKTTLLRQLALKSCDENLKKRERTLVPILIMLRELLESKKQLREYLDDVVERYGFPRAKDFIEENLSNGKCRLLLDGFDELANKENQEKIAEQIQRFIEKYHKNQIIVTSRIAGYHDELKGFTKLELMEFDDEQIEQFIENWFGKSNPERAKSMFDAIKRNEQIKALARNPLMLATIAIIHEKDEKLPQRKAALYNRCVEILLSDWDVRRGKNIYPSDKKELILRKLAFYAHSENKGVVSEEEVVGLIRKYLAQAQLKEGDIKPFIDEICKRSYLLQQISMDNYAFLHLSFQEYFAALELKEQANGISTIIEHLSEPWWEEPTLFYAGISKDATALIERIKNEVPEDMFYSNLMLFGKCVAEAEFTEPSLREEIINDLWSLYQETEFRSLWKKAINILALIKPDNIIDLLISNLEDESSDVRAHAASALGNIGGERAIQPLINALADEDSYVRESAAYALGSIGSEKAIEPLIYALADKERSVRESAVDALGHIGDERAIQPLINALADKERSVRENAVDALCSIGSKKAIEPLINALADKNGDVRWGAASALGGIGDESAVESLIYVLADIEPSVRGSAADALGRIGSEKAVESLIDALDDEDSDVRWRVASALGSIGGEKAIEPLINMLSDDDSDVRGSAADALGRIGSERAIQPLINALTDKERDVRWSAAAALGSIGSEKAIEPLINMLGDDDSDVRGSAADALGSIGSKGAVEALINALADEERDVRRRAAAALGRIGSEEAVEALINALTDKERDVRWSVAFALGRIGSKKAIQSLINALADQDSYVRGSVAYALGSIGGEKAIQPLIYALADKDISVRGSAADALGRIGSEKAIEPLKRVLLGEGGSSWGIVKKAAFTALEQISRRTGKRIVAQ